MRIPFAQLRALVVSLIDEPGAAIDDENADADADAAEREFDAQPTTYALNRPRVSTLDALIASLPPRR